MFIRIEELMPFFESNSKKQRASLIGPIAYPCPKYGKSGARPEPYS